MLYALSRLPHASATYEGLAYALGLSTARGTYGVVTRAKRAGVVTVTQTGKGAGARAVIRISPQGTAILDTLRNATSRNHRGTHV